MRRRQNAWGYVEVNSPDMLERKLWELSGHWEKFAENMYIAETPDERIYCCKPMNCPGHVQIFKHGLKSYRDLPLRLAEFGKVHRYEPSGALHGLLRVRHFTQDDAHIFCTEEQITEECVKLNEQMLSIYRDFGFTDVVIAGPAASWAILLDGRSGGNRILHCAWMMCASGPGKNRDSVSVSLQCTRYGGAPPGSCTSTISPCRRCADRWLLSTTTWSPAAAFTGPTHSRRSSVTPRRW